MAKRVHEETGVGHGRASLAEIGLQQARRHLVERPGLVAIVGVGELARRAVGELAERGIEVLIVNRTEAAAAALANEYGLQYTSLEAFVSAPPEVSVLITATAAPGQLLGREELERLASSSKLLIVDLAVPADVDPASAGDLGIELLNMDDILRESRRTQAERHGQLGPARVLVDEAVLRVRRRSMDRTLAPILAAMQKRYRQTLDEGLRQLLESRPDSEGSLEGLEGWSERMAHRLAHIPSSALRGVAQEGGLQAIRVFFEGTDAQMESVVERVLTQGDRIEPHPQLEEGR